MEILLHLSPSKTATRKRRMIAKTKILRALSYGSLAVCAQSLVALLFLAFACVSVSRAQPARPIRLVALGDSLTAGYGLPAKDAFPAVLQRALRAAGWNVTVKNAGVSGDTASDGLNRLDWSVGKNVDGVILELGANDMLRGIDPAVTRAALATILSRLTARKIKVLIAGMKADPALGKAYGRSFQSIYPDLAKKYHAALYPFFLDGVAGSPDLELADAMHPNALGVRKIVTAMLPPVEGFLRTIVAQAKS